MFPQDNLQDRLRARDAFVLQKTEENSSAIWVAKDLNGKAFKVGYYDMAFLQILWSQNETRRMPNPLTQFPSSDRSHNDCTRQANLLDRSASRAAPAALSCHHNGNTTVNGVPNDTFQDYNIHEPGVVAETTVDNDGVFLRLNAMTTCIRRSLRRRTSVDGRISAAATRSISGASGTAYRAGSTTEAHTHS